MVTTSWKRKLQFFSFFSLVIEKREISQIFNVYFCTKFQTLKTYCSSIFSFMILILLTEDSLVSFLIEVFRNKTKVSNFCVTTITFATSTTSTRYSKLSDAVIVTHFLTMTGNLERSFVTCSGSVEHFYPRNVHKPEETLFEKLDAFYIPF